MEVGIHSLVVRHTVEAGPGADGVARGSWHIQEVASYQEAHASCVGEAQHDILVDGDAEAIDEVG